MLQKIINNPLLNLLKNNIQLNFIYVLITGLVIGFFFFVSFYLRIELYVFLLIIALFTVLLLILYPKLWLYVTLIISGIFFHGQDEGVSVLDAITAAYFLGSVVIWFIFHTLLNRRKTAYNLGDWLILTFFLFLLLNFFVALLNDSNLLQWIREYFLFSILLIYFPIRELIRTEQDLKKFLIFFSFIVIGVGIYQIFLYITKLNKIAEYAYQIKSGININQTLYTIASSFGFVFAFYQKKFKTEIILVIFTGIAIVFLIATFSRTFWVTLAAVIIILFLFFSFKKKLKIINYTLIISLILVGLAFIYFKDNLELFFQIVFGRLTSATMGTKDPSVVARLMEWNEVTRQILNAPLYGAGLGTKFTFYFVIYEYTIHTNIIHNGFLYLIYRVGIPLSMFYFGFLIYYFILSYDNLIYSLRASSNFLKALAISNFMGFVILFIVNFTSAQFFQRDGIVITALLIVFISLNKNFLENNIKKNN